MRRNLDKEHLLELTLAVYRVTAIFPAKEELSQKIRKLADGILTDLLTNECSENGSRYIEGILELFDLAEKENWADQRNFLVLRREYEKIRQSLGAVQGSGKTVENSNNHRQDKIIATINGNGMIKIGDLIKLFPGINRRTVLRDLDKLCQTGIMVRNGIGRGVHYVKNATLSQ